MFKDSYHQGSIQGSKMTTQGKTKKSPTINKNVEKISKLNIDVFDEIEDPQEREVALNDAIERMKKSIEEIQLREAVNAKKIQKLRGDNANLKEKVETLEVDLKASEKTKELDTNYLLQQEELLARAKMRTRVDAPTGKSLKEIKKLDDGSKKIQTEIKGKLKKFMTDGGYMESTKDDIDGLIEYFLIGI